MKRLLLILTALLVAAPSPSLAKWHHDKNAASEQQQHAQPTTAAAATQAPSTGSQPQPAPDEFGGDVTKTLDDVLSKPIEKLVKEAPKPQTLKGQAELDAASGGDTANVPGMQALTPKVGKPVLQGSASMTGSVPLNGMESADDPDFGDQQLAIEWDRWRNRLLRAVQMQVQVSVNNPDPDEYVRPRFDRFTGLPLPKFPLGTEAWFDCEVTADRRIARCVITQTSGFQAYDKAVLDGIRALDGTSMLTFPRGSKRASVRQEAGIRTATQSVNKYYNFGDVERYNAPQRGY